MKTANASTERLGLPNSCTFNGLALAARAAQGPVALGVDLEVSRFQELQYFRSMGNAVPDATPENPPSAPGLLLFV